MGLRFDNNILRVQLNTYPNQTVRQLRVFNVSWCILLYFKLLQIMESDDDLYLLECLNQAERSDLLLFTRPDGLPMAFDNLDSDEETKEIIYEHGGIVVDSVLASNIFKENTIKICNSDTTYDTSEEIFDKRFIYDCLKTNNICDLDNYRLNKRVQFFEVAYDSIDVLLGYKGWDDVKLFREVEQEDAESPLPSTVEIKEDESSMDYSDLEQIGSLKTEDEVWEARAPEQVYISQDPEKEVVGTCEVEMEDYEFETENQDFHLNSQHIDVVPDFVTSLLDGKFI